MTKRITDWNEVPLVCNPREAAEVLGISSNTIHRRIKDGLIQAVSTPSGPRITKAALMDSLGVIPPQANPQTDPVTISLLEGAQNLINEAMRRMEVA